MPSSARHADPCNAAVHLDVYPVGNCYLGSLRLPTPLLLELNEGLTEHPPLLTETVIVLDCSGSMGSFVRRFLVDILPLAFKKLGMRPDERVTVIGFSSGCEVHRTTVARIATVPLYSSGPTMMCGAVHALGDFLLDCSTALPVRILTVSDGFVHDCEQVAVAASELRGITTEREGLVIDSKAMRLFTSQSQPDTRAVAALLQLSSSGDGTLVDVSNAYLDDVMADSVADLFGGDQFNGFQLSLEAEDENGQGVLMENPWRGSSASHKMMQWWLPRSVAGSSGASEKVLWLSRLPSKPLILNGRFNVPVVQHGTISNETYVAILSSQVNRYVVLLSLLKVVNTATSKDEMSKIVEFFKEVEYSLEASAPDSAPQFPGDAEESGSERRKRVLLMKRARELRRTLEHRKVMLANRLASIANDDRIANFNSAQSAEFLRAVGHGSAAKGLVRRAGMDLDFNQCAIDDARAIAAHIDELETVDDSKHATSFVSQGTTLDGLRAVALLVNGGTEGGEPPEALTSPASADTLEGVTALDILELLNLVGVAANGAVGDYPDPYRYFVRHIHTGVYLSLGDLLTMDKQQRAQSRAPSHNAENGFAWSGIRVPWSDVAVTDVIPVFEDARIQQFVRKYAPRLFSFTVSLGMRRVIADIPQTGTASAAAGLLYMIRVLQKEGNSEVHVRIARMIMATLLRSRDPRRMKEELSIFSQAAQQSDRLAFTDVFSISAMLLPLSYTLLHDESPGTQENVQRVMRALYVNEVWSVVRRFYKGKQDGDAIIQAYLRDLLGIEPAAVRAMANMAPFSFVVDTPVDDIPFAVKIRSAEDFSSIESDDAQSEVNASQEPSEGDTEETGKGDAAPQDQNTAGSIRKDASEMFKAIKLLDVMFALPAYLKTLAKASQSDSDKLTDEALASQLREIEKRASGESEESKPDVRLNHFATECLGMEKDTNAVQLKRNALVLALLYPTFDVRCVRASSTPSEDKDSNSEARTNASLLPDVASPAAIDALATSYALKEYRNAYTRMQTEKRNEEQRILTSALIQHICEEPYIDALKWWRNGLYILPDGTHTSNLPEADEGCENDSRTLRFYHKQIVDTNSAGASDLRTALLSANTTDVVDRLPKLEVLLVGRDCTSLTSAEDDFDGPIVWNSGSVLRGVRASWWQTWYAGEEETRKRWDIIATRCKTTQKYVYKRDQENRHTHSNAKCSYWALGYATLEDMAESVGKEEWDEYCELHTNCCGLQAYSAEENKKRQFSLISAPKESNDRNEIEPPKKKNKK